MSAPHAIPEDIRKKAQAVWPCPPDEYWNLADAIAVAILVERERCAKIVEDNNEVTSLKTGKRTLEPRTDGNLVGLAYAAAIREGGQ